MISTSKYCILPLLDPILDRFCSEILPKIHDTIKFLNVESFSMERVFLATTYPNLFGLGLYGIEGKRIIDLFSDSSLFTTYSLKNQISSLVITMNINTNEALADDIYALLLTHIFTIFQNLRLLFVNPSPVSYLCLSINNFPSTFNSSTLVELHVGLSNFNDCLLMLDGRFNQLSIFHVNIDIIRGSSLVINNKEKLPNLSSFVLYTAHYTNSYDKLIVPLLHRMTNLERLHLSFVGYVTKSFIDGNNLKQNIIYHMPLLKKFIFNIRSVWFDSPMNIPSTEDIQQTFKDLKDMHIISCVDYFQKEKYSQCLVYSYPYELKHYREITNQFPGGLFRCVREVSLHDEYPFEHEFFLRVARSFPLLEELTLINKKKQINRCIQNQNKHLPIIKYSHLIQLDLSEADQDYYEQFLFDTKTCLPNNLRVRMNYQSVKKVTRNFRRNTTRYNCIKIIHARFYNKFNFPEHLKDYFPNAYIC